MKAAAICLMLAGLAVALPVAPDSPKDSSAGPAACTAPPAPGGATRVVPEGHAKASSFSPSHSRKRAFGAPIPKPIVSRHVKSRHKAVTARPPASSK